MAFLFTSPLVSPIIIPLFLSLLGPRVTLVYAVVAVGMATAISYFLQVTGFSRHIKQEVLSGPAPACGCAEPKQPAPVRPHETELSPLVVVQHQQAASCCAASGAGPRMALPSALPTAPLRSARGIRVFQNVIDQFRKLLPYIIPGVAIGSVIHGSLPADLVARLAGTENPLAIPIAAVAGIPLYLRVSTMVPIAASLIAKGMSVGAVITLIIGGAGASLPEVAMLRGLFKTPLLVAFITAVLVMAISAGLLVNLALLQKGAPRMPPAPIDLVFQRRIEDGKTARRAIQGSRGAERGRVPGVYRKPRRVRTRCSNPG